MMLPERINEVYKKATKIYSKQDVEKAFDKLSFEISEKLAEKNPIILCVVIGGIVPLGNLLPRLDFPLEVDYIHVSRYAGTTKGGKIFWKVTPNAKLKERVVLIVDDILDGGLTLSAVYDYCKTEGAKEIYSAVLVDKKKKREDGGTKEADFIGLTVEDRYVFGYGLDYKEYLRNAPGIYAVASEHE